MSLSDRDDLAPSRSNYWIKTFGSSLADCRFHRLPTVIQKAKAAIPDDSIVGFLACALDRPPRMTGLIFCDRRRMFPEGLPAHTPPVLCRYEREGYLIVVVEGGGEYVVAHWYFQNGALGPLYELH
jgi:hypothetical protein